MKRHIFTLFFVILTSLGVYSQEKIAHLPDYLNETAIAADSDTITEIAFDSITELQSSSEFYGLESVEDTSVKPFNYKNSPEWGKYKVLRAVGWSSFGVGLATMSAGVIALMWESVLTGKNSVASTALTVGGGVLTVSSIPILISAYHYRNKAKKIALNVGVTSINTHTFSNRIDYTPALSFALTF